MPLQPVMHWFKSRFCYSLAMKAWSNHSTSLNLINLTCETG